MTVQRGVYRLVGMDGLPHPILDTPFDSIDAAIVAAKKWNRGYVSDGRVDNGSIGIEV